MLSTTRQPVGDNLDNPRCIQALLTKTTGFRRRNAARYSRIIFFLLQIVHSGAIAATQWEGDTMKLRALAAVALAGALTIGVHGTAQAFSSDRAAWLNYLHEERASRAAPASRSTVGGYTAPQTGIVRPGRQAAFQRRTAPRPETTTRRIQRASVAATTRQMDPRFLPRRVDYNGPHRPGTVVIDTSARFLYLVGSDGTARRYGVGVGRQGFQWNGVERISRKREWPGWTPPAAMRKREPDLPKFMPGGPDNPLGARALYLGGTLYRIHGSNAPWTIGHAVSSGCIRMRNEDVKDLYTRVDVGTKVVVQP